jgi:hypothetical protein
MTAGIYNFTIDQGAQYTTTIVYQNPNGTPIDLTGYTAAMQLRVQAAAPNPASLTLTSAPGGGIVITPLAGQLDITITTAQAATLDARFYVYDLELTLSGVVSRIIQGQITVSAQVTQ